MPRPAPGPRPAALPVLLAALACGATASACSKKPREVEAPTPVVVEAPAAPARPPEEERVQAARQKLVDGDEAGAVASFDALIETLPPDSPRRRELRCELAAVFNNRAERLHKSDMRVGEADMRRALELCPDSALVRENLATLLVVRANAEEKTAEGRARASRALVEALELHETRAEAHASLAELLIEENDPKGALEHMRRAATLRPDKPYLATRVSELERTASVEGSFRDNRHNHFVARFEGYAQERLAWTALDTLEQAYFSIGKKLNIYPREPITVVIYTGDQYKQVTNLPDWAAGSFDGKIRVREGSLLSSGDDLTGLLRHEYTHAVVATLPVRLPAWLNEGLAKHMEGADAARSAAFVKRNMDDLPSWDTLSQPSFTNIQDTKKAGVAYATATALVHELVELRGEYALQTLMSRLATGEDFATAFMGTYAMEPRKHYDRWVESL